MEDGHCVRTIHAETNALLQAARYGHAVDGATLYCTTLPCWSCYKQVSNAGILQIIYDEPYRAEEHLKRVYAHAAMTGMLIHRLDAAGTLISDHVDETFSKRVVLRKEGS